MTAVTIRRVSQIRLVMGKIENLIRFAFLSTFSVFVVVDVVVVDVVVVPYFC